MKALPKILLALTAVAALSVACPAKANLITNPGFETGDLTGWNTPSGSSWNVISGQAHSGTYSAEVGTAVGDTDSLSQSVVTTSGTTYTIDFFIKTTSGTLNVTFGGTVFNHLFASPTNGYVEFTFNATASGANTNLQFDVIGSGAHGTLWLLDDVSVNPTGVGVPDGGTTVSLLGCALLGLAALRRKLSC